MVPDTNSHDRAQYGPQLGAHPSANAHSNVRADACADRTAGTAEHPTDAQPNTHADRRADGAAERHANHPSHRRNIGRADFRSDVHSIGRPVHDAYSLADTPLDPMAFPRA